MGSEKARAEYDEFEQYRIAPYWRERVRDKKKDFLSYSLSGSLWELYRGHYPFL